MTTDRPMYSRSRNTPTPTTAFVLIGSTGPKSRSRFSLNSTVARWRSRRTAANRADHSIAAEAVGLIWKTRASLPDTRGADAADRSLSVMRRPPLFIADDEHDVSNPNNSGNGDSYRDQGPKYVSIRDTRQQPRGRNQHVQPKPDHEH